MASTNKTTHYELSQYVGTDKPTYLTDYNNDMSAIDTGIYNAQTKADSAYTLAGTADGKADTAGTTANSALTSAGTANTNIGTMANLTTSEKSSLVGAINEVNGNINKFNLTTFLTYDTQNITVYNVGGTISSGSMTVAKNSDGSIAKIYGYVQGSAPSDQRFTCIISNTGLAPTTDITISPAGVTTLIGGNGMAGNASIVIKTNGDIELRGTLSANNQQIWLMPCLYFIKDFGDTD